MLKRVPSSPNKVIPSPRASGSKLDSEKVKTDSPRVRPVLPPRPMLNRPPSTNNVTLPDLLEVSTKIRNVSASKRASLTEKLTLRSELVVPLSHLEQDVEPLPAAPSLPTLPPVKRNNLIVPPPPSTPPPLVQHSGRVTPAARLSSADPSPLRRSVPTTTTPARNNNTAPAFLVQATQELSTPVKAEEPMAVKVEEPVDVKVEEPVPAKVEEPIPVKVDESKPEEEPKRYPRPLPPRPQLSASGQERTGRSSSVPDSSSTSPAPPTADDNTEHKARRSASVPTDNRVPLIKRQVKKPREPLPAGAAMFDHLTGRRRSSATVAQVALFLMQDDALFTIPRDTLTDALNWTALEDDENNCFSHENVEGLEFAKIHEKFVQKRGARESFVQRAKRVNESHAVTITRMFRGWLVRHKMKSFHWVRCNIQLAIRSRNSTKVQMALNCSYELGKRFVRPEREHQLALHTLDTIREEQAVRRKLGELAELDCRVSRSNGEDKIVKKFASVAERVTRCQQIDRFAFQDELSIKAMQHFRVLHNRMELRNSLKRAIETNSKAELLAAVKEFELEHFGCWQQQQQQQPETAGEHRVARDLLVRILHEEPVLRELLAAACGEDIDMIEEQIARAVRELSFTPSQFAQHALETANAVLDLRRAMVRAQKSKLWMPCEKQVNEVKLKLQLVLGKNQDFQPLLQVLAEEMDNLSSALDARIGVADLIESLKDSLQRCDVDDMQNVLKKSERLGLFERTADNAMQQLISQAQALVAELLPVHEKLARALEGCNRNPVTLKLVADEVRNDVRTNSTDALLVKECDRLVELAETELAPLLAKAYDEVPDRADLLAVVERVRTQERMGGMESLQAVDSMLALDDMRLCQEQLRAATRLQLTERKIHLTMRYRSLHLEQHGQMFRLDRFPDLREAKEFFGDTGKPKSLLLPSSHRRTSACTARMLAYSRNPIPSPLTRTCCSLQEPRLRKLAVGANRTLLAYCGDLVEMDLKIDFGGDVCLGLHELLHAALKREPALRDELFVQCMKHLTDNPRCNSRTRAWNVLAFLLITFPPSTTLDLFLEYFIRNNAPLADLESLLQKLHQSNFGGVRPNAPTLQEIRARQHDGGSVEGL